MRWIVISCVTACASAPLSPSLDAPPAQGSTVDASADGPIDAIAPASGWHTQVIYLAMVDRFRDGDPSNNDATGCYAPSDPERRHGGDFEGLRKHLDYIRDVGATAVWITPPEAQAGPAGRCGYHGYWIDYVDPADDALAPELGTPDELVHLVSDMHAAGMRFVLDMVVNHAGDTSRIPAQHPDWFHDPATCASRGPSDVYCPLDHHPDFAQEKPDVAAYLSAVEARAVTRYAIDGIRMDTAKHVPAPYFHDSFFPAVRAANPSVFSIAEIFDEGSLDSFVPYLDAGFDSAFHYPLYAALVGGIAHGGSVDRIAQTIADTITKLGADRANDLVLFVDNHDVPRFANLPGLGVSENDIRRRMMLALDLIFTLPGIPQLYYGDELGMYGGGDPDNRRDLPAWAMDPVQRAQAHGGVAVAGSDQIYTRIHKLSALRRSTPALADGSYRELWRQNGAANPNVYAFSRGSGGEIRIVAISNGAAHSGTMHIPLHDIPDGTVLVDDLGDGAPANVTVTGGDLVVDLPARSAAIYRLAN